MISSFPNPRVFLLLALAGSAQVGLIQICKPQVGGSIPLAGFWIDTLQDFVNYHKGSIKINVPRIVPATAYIPPHATLRDPMRQ